MGVLWSEALLGPDTSRGWGSLKNPSAGPLLAGWVSMQNPLLGKCMGALHPAPAVRRAGWPLGVWAVPRSVGLSCPDLLRPTTPPAQGHTMAWTDQDLGLWARAAL